MDLTNTPRGTTAADMRIPLPHFLRLFRPPHLTDRSLALDPNLTLRLAELQQHADLEAAVQAASVLTASGLKGLRDWVNAELLTCADEV